MTTPVELTVATALFALVQEPPAKPFEVKVDMVPILKLVFPEIVPALGSELTETDANVLFEQPLAETT